MQYKYVKVYLAYKFSIAMAKCYFYLNNLN